MWNDALAHCIEQYRAGNKKPQNKTLQKQFITRHLQKLNIDPDTIRVSGSFLEMSTQAKKTSEREWLGEVSNIALQQSLNGLEQAYQNFFKSCNSS